MLLDQVSRTKGLAGQPQQGYVLRMFIGLRSAVYVAVLATAASAQTNTGCLHRIFPVTVADKHGNAVAGLPISDFRAEVEHRPVKLLPVALPTQQPRVVVLLDTSTSITPGGRIPIYPWVVQDEWDLAKFLVADIVNSAPASTELAFATFAAHLTVEVPFGKDRDAIREVLLERASPLRPAVPPYRRTALYDAILEATGLFGAPQLGDAVYVITDGGDNNSKHTFVELQNKLEQKGVRLFCAMLGSSMWFVPDRRMRPELLQSIARHSGGYSVIFDIAHFNHKAASTRAMAAAAHTLYRYLDSFYEIDAELPFAFDKPYEWKLEVLNPRGRKAGFSVLYPKTIFPCESIHVTGRPEPSGTTSSHEPPRT